MKKKGLRRDSNLHWDRSLKQLERQNSNIPVNKISLFTHFKAISQAFHFRGFHGPIDVGSWQKTVFDPSVTSIGGREPIHRGFAVL